MKTFIVGNALSGLATTGIALFAWAVGIGHPNCAPTWAGHAEFWASLFGCGCAAFSLTCATIASLVAASRCLAR